MKINSSPQRAAQLQFGFREAKNKKKILQKNYSSAKKKKNDKIMQQLVSFSFFSLAPGQIFFPLL
jgi:threonyl-tRNA synthetase